MAELVKSATDKSGVRSEVLLGLGVMAMIFVLIIPLPPALLDVLIAVNISFGILVLLITLGAREALELSTYPTILLLTTLFRLALNVASTRLILLKGQAGSVIQSFGDFVVGGDLVVGVIIFAILVIIQFIVITKGSGRVSEVAARFTLDAMPGKQMAIDADLNSGLITETDARERREKIAQEAEFYGSMDGASKFVRGDAIAGLIINVVNVIGGVIIGMGGGLSITAALEKYSILTIGDGLVSQIPALIIAVAAGLLVTKTSSKQRFATEFGSQLLGNRRAIGTGAAVMLLLALVPGFPKLPFVLLGIALFVVQRTLKTREEREEAAKNEPAPPEPEPEGPELSDDQLGRLLEVDRLGIEVGFRLIPLVDADRKGGLLDHIGMIRRQFARDLGLVVPPIRMKDNLGLDANAYRILVGGQEVARGELYPEHVLAMDPGTAEGELPGIRGEDPTFGLPATWVREERRSDAEIAGYTVVDATSVLVTHLTETLRRHAPELLSRQDVRTLLDRVKENSPAIVEELIPDVLGLGEVQAVLQELLSERIPIKNLPSILEVLADNGRKTKDLGHLTELVRQRLGRMLTARHLGPDGVLRAIVLDPRVEAALEAEVTGREAVGAESVPLARLRERVLETYGAAMQRGHDPIILARATVRRHLADMLAGLDPKIPVLSYNEVTTARRIEPVGQIDLTAPSAEMAAAQSM
ncbi:MAG: flagellar biosynthesis protein FlhA [Planctomycetota bacterium]